MLDGKNFLVSYHYSIDRSACSDMLITISGDGSFGYQYHSEPYCKMPESEAVILAAANVAREKVARNLYDACMIYVKESEIFIEVKNIAPV